MTEASDSVLRLLAQADGQPVETDAPTENTGLPPYDAGLQVELEDFGPEALREWGQIVVRDVDNEARFNSGVWYALKMGLNFEQKNGCLILTDPSAE